MSVRTYRDLKVWQGGMQLAVAIYRATEHLPEGERFGLISQMRRAAVSVAANVAEGHERQHDRELCQFLYISAGSLAELETYLCLCEELGYLDGTAVHPLFGQAAEVGRMLNGLISRVRKSSR